MNRRVIQGFFPGGRPRPVAVAPMAQPRAMPGVPGAPLRVFAARPPVAQRGLGAESFQVDPGRLGLVGGGGKPLPDPVRGQMEAALGADFSSVRIHVGPQAERIGAIAFTTGSDIYFAPGRFQPDTVQGKQLLGHELAHVVQQRQGRVGSLQGAGLLVVHDRALEAEADRLGSKAANFRIYPKTGAPHDATCGCATGHVGWRERGIQPKKYKGLTSIRGSASTAANVLEGRTTARVRLRWLNGTYTDWVRRRSGGTSSIRWVRDTIQNTSFSTNFGGRPLNAVKFTRIGDAEIQAIIELEAEHQADLDAGNFNHIDIQASQAICPVCKRVARVFAAYYGLGHGFAVNQSLS